MLINILFNFLLISLFIKELYVNNLFYFFDIVSSLFSYILIFFQIFDKKMETNIKSLLGDLNKNKIQEIKYKSLKIYIFNILLVLNTRILLDKNNNFFKHYKLKKKIYKYNDDYNEGIILNGHIGIFYSFLACRFILNKPLSFIYKNKNKILDKIIFPKKIMNENDIYPYLSNDIINFYKNKIAKIYCITFDHYYSKGIEIEFFNKKFKSHKLPSIIYNLKKNIPMFIAFTYFNFDKKTIDIKLTKIKCKINDSNKNIMQNIFNIYELEIKKNPCQFIWLKKNVFKKY